MSTDNTPDTDKYDDKIKHGEEKLQQKSEEKLDKMSDQMEQRPEANTAGDPQDDPSYGRLEFRAQVSGDLRDEIDVSQSLTVNHHRTTFRLFANSSPSPQPGPCVICIVHQLRRVSRPGLVATRNQPLASIFRRGGLGVDVCAGQRVGPVGCFRAR